MFVTDKIGPYTVKYVSNIFADRIVAIGQNVRAMFCNIYREPRPVLIRKMCTKKGIVCIFSLCAQIHERS